MLSDTIMLYNNLEQWFSTSLVATPIAIEKLLATPVQINLRGRLKRKIMSLPLYLDRKILFIHLRNYDRRPALEQGFKKWRGQKFFASQSLFNRILLHRKKNFRRGRDGEFFLIFFSRHSFLPHSPREEEKISKVVGTDNFRFFSK